MLSKPGLLTALDGNHKLVTVMATRDGRWSHSHTSHSHNVDPHYAPIVVCSSVVTMVPRVCPVTPTGWWPALPRGPYIRKLKCNCYTGSIIIM